MILLCLRVAKIGVFNGFYHSKTVVSKGVKKSEKVVTSRIRSGFLRKWIRNVDPKTALFLDLVKNRENTTFRCHGVSSPCESGVSDHE